RREHLLLLLGRERTPGFLFRLLERARDAARGWEGLGWVSSRRSALRRERGATRGLRQLTGCGGESMRFKSRAGLPEPLLNLRNCGRAWGGWHRPCPCDLEASAFGACDGRQLLRGHF